MIITTPEDLFEIDILQDKLDGTLTIICMPNLVFDIPYDTSSWGSCLAKCPVPTKITTTADLEVAYDQMTGGAEDELWEGEQLVYRCRNESLVLNNDPDLIKIKYKCRNTGMHAHSGDVQDMRRYFQESILSPRRSLTGPSAPRSR